MTFLDLTDWYLKLEKVKSLASYSIIQVYLKKFNSLFGNMVVNRINPEDLENLIEKRKKKDVQMLPLTMKSGRRGLWYSKPLIMIKWAAIL